MAQTQQQTGDIFDQVAASPPKAQAQGGGDIFDQVASQPQAPSRPGLLDRMRSNWHSNTDPAPDDNAAIRVAKRAARSLASPLTNAIAYTRESPQQQVQDAMQTDQRMPSEWDALKGSQHPLTDAAGDLIAAGVGEGATKAVAASAGYVANKAGGGLQTLGEKVGNVTLGARAADKTYNTAPGAGISRNRIVGATKAGLLDKVQSRIDPLAQGRDTILGQSQAGPQDVRPEVNQPFNDITAVKTNPRTGAVAPSAQSRMVQTQRAINEVQDPNSGMPTGTPKPLDQLSPLEVSQLNRNVYDLADYSGTPDASLTNQAVKGAGSNLRDRLNQVAPEATDITDLLHDTLGARDVLQRQVSQSGGVPLTKTGIVGSTLGMGGRLAGSMAAAGLDTLGSGLRAVGGSLRPQPMPTVGPQNPPAPPRPAPVNMGTVQGQTVPPAGQLPPPGPTGAAAPSPAPPSPQLPDVPPTRLLAARQAAQRGELPAPGQTSPSMASPGVQPPPPANRPTLSMRVTPNTFVDPGRAPSGPYQVTPEGQAQPAVPPSRQLPAKTAPGKRYSTLAKGWDREAASQSMNLQDKVAAASTDHSTMTDNPPPSANQSSSTDTSQGRTPMGTAQPSASTPSGNVMQKALNDAMADNEKALGPAMGGKRKPTTKLAKLNGRPQQ
jgi:hypothetical protein